MHVKPKNRNKNFHTNINTKNRYKRTKQEKITEKYQIKMVRDY